MLECDRALLLPAHSFLLCVFSVSFAFTMSPPSQVILGRTGAMLKAFLLGTIGTILGSSIAFAVLPNPLHPLQKREARREREGDPR